MYAQPLPFHFFHFSEYPILNYFLLHGLMVIIVIMSFLQVLISVRRPLIVQIPPVSFQICCSCFLKDKCCPQLFKHHQICFARLFTRQVFGWFFWSCDTVKYSNLQCTLKARFISGKFYIRQDVLVHSLFQFPQLHKVILLDQYMYFDSSPGSDSSLLHWLAPGLNLLVSIY